MMYQLLVWVVSAAALLLTSKIVSGFEIKDFKTAMWASVVVGLLNMVLRPILLFLTFPVNFLTLGLFTFVVNAAILRLASSFFQDFKIAGWWSAILGSVVLTISNMILFSLF